MRRAFLILAGSLLFVGGLSAWSKPQKKSLSDLIVNYRSWQKANEKPVYLKPFISSLCRGPMSWQTDDNPHIPKYFTVYVNRVGYPTMFKAGNPKFPAGTVIVKEKLSSASNNAKPELMTVMVKKQSGFDPAHGDWQYFIADGAGKKTDDKDVAKCQSCHEQRKDRDYVFRDYLNAKQ